MIFLGFFFLTICLRNFNLGFFYSFIHFFYVVVVVLQFEDSLGNQLPKCFMQFYTFGGFFGVFFYNLSPKSSVKISLIYHNRIFLYWRKITGKITLI